MPPDRPAPKEIGVHFYQFNIGDYRRDTSHLTLLEHGIYRQLLDTYYLSENPIKLDLEEVMRTHSVRTADEERALKNVLKDFFDETPDGYFHKGCDRNIEAYRKKSKMASESAKARWSQSHANALPTDSERNANGMLTNNHKPITNNQEPIEKKKKRGSAPVSCPSDVDEKVWQDYIATRKSAITETALQILRKEAGLAGMTLDAVLSECTMRGWTGFKADWMKGKTTAGNRPLTVWEKSEQQKQEFSDRLWGRRKDDGRTIDATPLKLG
jgi:uncharacterized protein YdaU (DUF1376 family)